MQNELRATAFFYWEQVFSKRNRYTDIVESYYMQ